MADYYLGSTKILRGRFALPRTGLWILDAVLDGTTAPEGAQTLMILGRTWQGTVAPGRAGAPYEQVRVRVVGGAGKLSTVIGPRDFGTVSWRTALEDALSAAGEQLGQTDDALLATSRWMRAQEPAAVQMRRLLEQLPGVTWRVSPSGAIDFVKESWPASGAAAVLLQDLPTESSQVLAPDDADLLPGQTFQDRRIDRVEYILEPDRFRAQIWYQTAEGSDNDRLKTSIEGIVEAALAKERVDFSAHYIATVKGQDGNKLHVQFEDPRLGYGSQIPLRTPYPGEQIRVQAGARVMVGWDGGRPSAPYALLWETGTLVSSELDASDHILRKVPEYTIEGRASVQHLRGLDALLPPLIVVRGDALGNNGVAILGAPPDDLLGSDLAFMLTCTANPGQAGKVAEITYGKEFSRKPRHVSITMASQPTPTFHGGLFFYDYQQSSRSKLVIGISGVPVGSFKLSIGVIE